MATLVITTGSGGQPVELPEGLPPLREDVDVSTPPTFVPTNGRLYQKENFQPIGLNIQSEILSPEYLGLASKVDFGAYRITINESDFASPDSPNYLKLASIIDRIVGAGVEVLLTLDTNYLDPGTYSACLARVYDTVGGKVKSFQLLDNINQRVGVSLTAYNEALTLVRTVRELKKADFGIVLGGIIGIDRRFVKELNDFYILDRVDALAFNLFPDSSQMELPPSSATAIAPHSLYEAATLFSSMPVDKDIYVTSLGISTAVSPFGVSQLDQASMLARATLYLLNGGATRVFISSLIDTDPFSVSPSRSMGLFMADGTAKPAYYSIAKLAKTLRGAYFIVPYYLFQMSNEFPAMADPTFVNHLYDPKNGVISLFYWTTTMNPLDRYTNLIIYRTDIQPVSLVNLLAEENTQVPFKKAGNLTLFSRIPLSHVPTAVRLELIHRDG